MSSIQPLGREVAAGAVFGAALYSAGVYHPSVIQSQLRFDSFQMLQVMLGASAASALVFHIADRSGVMAKQVRAPAALGWFPYDGNIIGGALIGAGMALSGACPGTVIVQAAVGIPTGPFVALGGVLGAAAWLIIKPMMPASRANGAKCNATVASRASPASSSSPEKIPTVASALGTSEPRLLVFWEIMCVLAVGTLLKIWPGRSHALINPIAGGLFIGLAQAVTVYLANHTIGASKTYEDIAQGILRILRQSNPKEQKESLGLQTLLTPSIAFAVGVFGIAFLLKDWKAFGVAASNAVVDDAAIISKPRAILAGLSLVLGSRVAGGCTSGHCLSGLANFSLSSAITGAAMFAAGVAVASISM
ncbi:Hypothetical protein R9X50_00227900 [Acrodontium crateriforme]|uniref:Sulphur transport domain-containing protein n=1 Tax=Acrodontium crateriforme TaxID=150365 RepID=A0AAQ3R3D0_9PEZI|nr:Hypothetical protein R9X50_00227900 [Acrodontium crateriforme]